MSYNIVDIFLSFIRSQNQKKKLTGSQIFSFNGMCILHKIRTKRAVMCKLSLFTYSPHLRKWSFSMFSTSSKLNISLDFWFKCYPGSNVNGKVGEEAISQCSDERFVYQASVDKETRILTGYGGVTGSLS